MKRLLFIASLIVVFALAVNGQNSVRKVTTVPIPVPSLKQTDQTSTQASTTSADFKRCGSSDADEYRRAHDSIYAMQRNMMDAYVEQYLKDHPENDAKTTVTIPIVVHIIYNTTAQNIADSRVTDQIAATNADWAGTNAHSMYSFSSTLKANTNVQFCLAQRDPSGNATTGITRTQTSTATFNITGSSASCSGYPERCASSGGCNAWDVTKYLNVWVCNMGTSLCGISEFPTSPLNNYYGSTINYLYFGTTGSSAPYNLGGTLTHELGHCFNLYHIWGDRNGQSCSTTTYPGSDLCADTPPQYTMTSGHHTGVLTDNCTTTSPGIMYEDFMDYSNDQDYANFTPNQATRIGAIVASTGPAYSLTSSNGCTPVGAAAPVANFTASSQNVPVGTIVNFTDLSTNTPTAWTWTLTPATGFIYTTGTNASKNPSIQFNTVGSYTVALHVSNTSGNNTVSRPAYITVYTPTSGCDTVRAGAIATLPCGDSLVIYRAGRTDTGYVAGNNIYGDLEKAERFIAAGGTNKTVSTVLVYALKKGGTTDLSYVKLYNVSATTKKPTTVIGTSTGVSMSNLSTTGLTAYTFSTPVSVPADFFASVVLPTGATDTMVVASTKFTCYTADSLSWEKWSDNSWYSMKQAWFSNQANLDLAIFPIVCTTVGTNDISSPQENVIIFPNPANDQFTVQFLGGSQKNVVVEVYNTVGSLVKSFAPGTIDHVQMDMSDVSKGIYIINIKSDQGTVVKKLSIIK